MSTLNQDLFAKVISMEQLESRLELAVAKKVELEVSYEDGCLSISCTISW